MFKNKKQGLIVVDNDTIFLSPMDHHKNQQILALFSIQFLDTRQ
jgi:hypothetical protein